MIRFRRCGSPTGSPGATSLRHVSVLSGQEARKRWIGLVARVMIELRLLIY